MLPARCKKGIARMSTTSRASQLACTHTTRASGNYSGNPGKNIGNHPGDDSATALPSTSPRVASLGEKGDGGLGHSPTGNHSGNPGKNSGKKIGNDSGNVPPYATNPGRHGA